MSERSSPLFYPSCFLFFSLAQLVFVRSGYSVARIKSDLIYGSIIDLRVVSQWSVDVVVGGRWWCSGWLWWRVQ